MELSLVRPIQIGVGYVSQEFGENPQMYRMNGLAGHNGIDYAVPVGTPVRAPISGIVVPVANQGQVGYGRYVVIENELCGVLLAHLSEVLVQVGQEVQAAEVIALSGGMPGADGAGRSTGPHLHFGLYFKRLPNGQLRGRNPAYNHWFDPGLWRDSKL